MRLKEANKVVKKAKAAGIEVTSHRFGNRREYAVDFPWEETVFHYEDGLAHVRDGWMFSPHGRHLQRESVRLINEARECLGREPDFTWLIR